MATKLATPDNPLNYSGKFTIKFSKMTPQPFNLGSKPESVNIDGYDVTIENGWAVQGAGGIDFWSSPEKKDSTVFSSPYDFIKYIEDEEGDFIWKNWHLGEIEDEENHTKLR